MKRGRSVSGLAALLLLFSLAPAALAGTLDRVRETGTLRMGYVDDARPFSYKDASGTPAGYAVVLCQRVADAVKAELGLPALKSDFVAVGADERFAAVKDGRIDLLCTGGTPTVARREEVSFSIPVFVGGVSALLRDDAPERMREILEGRPEPYTPRWRASLGQILRGRKFLAVRGSTAEAWLKAKVDEFAIVASVEPVDDFAQAVEMVAAGKADALFADRALLLDAAARSPFAGELAILERYFTEEAAGLALPRTDEDFRLAIDRALSKLFRSDEIAPIYRDAFGKSTEQALRFLRIGSLPE